MLIEHYLIGIVIAVLFAGTAMFFLRKKFSMKIRLSLVLVILILGAAVWDFSTMTLPQTEQFTLTALGQKNEAAWDSQVFVLDITEKNGSSSRFSWAVEGNWIDLYHERYGWVNASHEAWTPDLTNRVVLQIPTGSDRKVRFFAAPYCGKVLVEHNGTSFIVDTYSSLEGTTVDVVLSDSVFQLKDIARQTTCYLVLYIALLLCLSIAYLLIKRFIVNSRIQKYHFLFQQLVHRDFTKKYKRTVLGIAWSMLSPLLSLLVMRIVFTSLLGSEIEHYTIYLFSGQLVFTFFSDSTNEGMASLLNNADIFTKVNVPKYLFLFSKNISSFINFGITLAIYFLFVLADGLPITWKFLLLIYPITCLVIFNLGMGLILSAIFVFFRDIQYLYSIFTMLLMYMSAIFYSIDSFPEFGRYLFLLNPVYLYIRYFRKIVIEGTIPSVEFHVLAAAYALLAFGIGCLIYKKKNHSFLYYV